MQLRIYFEKQCIFFTSADSSHYSVHKGTYQMNSLRNILSKLQHCNKCNLLLTIFVEFYHSNSL